jgi:hypothetical protein
MVAILVVSERGRRTVTVSFWCDHGLEGLLLGRCLPRRQQSQDGAGVQITQ